MYNLNVYKNAGIPKFSSGFQTVFKGDRKDPRNYRPVSLLSICSKILETVVCDKIIHHVSPVLSQAQHGFLAGRSCESNLTCLVDQLWRSMTDGDQTDVIYTDYSSAFTSVNHALLLYKLQKSYHLSGAALSWFRSYLSGREQCVVLDGQCSDWVPVRSGVPEGSICGPILFVLFCNDVPAHISSKCLIYADDLKLYRQIRFPWDALLLQTSNGPVAQSVERWTPCGGSTRPVSKVRGSRRDGRPMFIEHPGGYGCGWWQAVASWSQRLGPAVRGYVRTLNFRL